MAFLVFTSWNLTENLRPQLIKRTAILLIFSCFFFQNLFACNVICRVSLNLSIGNLGYSIVTPSLLLVDNDCDPSDFRVELLNNLGVNMGDTVMCHHVGQTLLAKVIRISDNNFCTTQITINDYLNPIIGCSDTTLLCGNDISPQALGYPSVMDNCTNLSHVDLSFVDIPTNYSCGFIDNGDTLNAIIERRWTAVDSVGNQGMCSQWIRLKKSYLSDVLLPPNLDDTQLPAIDCQSDPTDLSLTGFPSINGLALNASNFCDLAADYSDQQLNICGAGYLILRTWTMADWCNGDLLTHVQFIKVADTIAPVFSCPQDFTVSTLVNSCFASVSLPTTTAIDDCSSVDINPVWQFGTGYGPFHNVPLGTYPVTYSATDACGNVSTCQILVTVADQVPPQIICKQFLQVSLGLNGQAYLPASSLDGGTYDNCILGDLLVSTDGVNFTSSVLLDCQDALDNPVIVTLRAYDFFGNHNECDVEVTLIDQLAPSITCPDSITINCGEDYLNTNITGYPIYSDNCLLDTIYFVDSVYLNTCNVGFVDRYWVVVDAAGMQNSCVQRIRLEDTTILNITFPNNYNTSTCNPDLSPAITGEPFIQNGDCEFLSITFDDDTLAQVLPACFVVYRHWKIINWCTYDPNTGVGFWENTQVLSVEDQENPMLVAPNDTTVFSFAEDCGLYYFNLNIASAVDCSQFVNITNTSLFADSTGADASGNYPIGVHQIYFTAEDNCGNATQSSMQLTVVDEKVPTAVCRTGLIFTIDSNGNLTIDPSEIDEGSFDNCTPDSLLTFSLSQTEFTCADIGTNPIVLFVYDEAGNVGACNTQITIQNNNGICPDASISGHLFLWSGGNINNANIELSGGNDGQVFSNADGFYEFENLFPGQNYTIEAFKDGDDNNGISVLDIVVLSRHLIGLSSFTSPYQYIAGDVDMDNTLSAFDLIQMQKLILLIDTIIPNGDSWRFIPDDFVFTNPNRPFLDVIPNFHEVNGLSLGETVKGFVGIKLGDVSGNANPQLSVQINPSMQGNETDGLQFYANESIESFGFHIVVNAPTNLDEVTLVPNPEFKFNFDHYYDPVSGEVRVVAHSLSGIDISPRNHLFTIFHEGEKSSQPLKIKKCQVIGRSSILSAEKLKVRSN